MFPIVKFIGPYEIVAREGRWIYYVKDKATGTMYRRHYDDIKMAQRTQHALETNHNAGPPQKRYDLRKRF